MCGDILGHLADLFPKTMNISTNVNDMLVYYQNLWDLRDKRVDDWPMMNSPWPTISLCVGYIYLSMILGKLKLSNSRFEANITSEIQNPNIWDSTFCQLSTENYKVFLFIVATNAGAISFFQTFVLQ